MAKITKEKNLITFLESRGELGLHEICLDGNNFDAEYIEDTTDLIAFNLLTIYSSYKIKGKQVIDVQDEKGEMHVGFNLNLFRPYKSYLNKSFQDYLRTD